jgi:hypothetical protein
MFSSAFPRLAQFRNIFSDHSRSEYPKLFTSPLFHCLAFPVEWAILTANGMSLPNSVNHFDDVSDQNSLFKHGSDFRSFSLSFEFQSNSLQKFAVASVGASIGLLSVIRKYISNALL